MACKYKEAFLDQPSHTSQPRRPQHGHYSLSGQWQLIVKLVGAKSRKPNRWSSAYEAITRQRDSLFYSVNSCVAGTVGGALLDAMVEAAIKTKNHGFQYILFLGASRHLVQLFQHRKTTDRLQQIRLADLDFLTQNGLCCDVFLVPHLVVKSVWLVAKMDVKCL